MLHPHIEELESRQLLNGSFSAAGRELPPGFATIISVLLVAERWSFADNGSQVSLSGWGWTGEGGIEIVRLRGGGFAGFEDSAPGPRDLRPFGHQGPPNPFPPETREGGKGSASMDHPGAGPGNPWNSAEATLPVPPGPANNSPVTVRAAGTNFQIVFERPNLPPLPVLGNSVETRNLALDVPGLFAFRAPVPAIQVKDAVFAGAGNLGETGRQGHASGDLSTPAPVDEPSWLPSPRISDALAILPAVDASTLELGIEQFLNQLERLCPRPVQDGDPGALWPWVVAITAAATACEIARRELKRPPLVPAADRNDLSFFPLDPL